MATGSKVEVRYRKQAPIEQITVTCDANPADRVTVAPSTSTRDLRVSAEHGEEGEEDYVSVDVYVPKQQAIQFRDALSRLIDSLED